LALDAARWRAMSETAYQTSAEYTWKKAADGFETALCLAVERTRQEEL
jgi:hypothetical protein